MCLAKLCALINVETPLLVSFIFMSSKCLAIRLGLGLGPGKGQGEGRGLGLGLRLLVRGGGGQWRKMANNGARRIMANNGDGEFGFFICQIRHFSPMFDIGISYLTDF